MISLPLILKNRKAVLGRNERQLFYIRRFNLRRAKRIADNKILSKVILKRNNIPVPKKITVIRSHKDLEYFDFDSLPKSFVVKPVKGTRGGGIEIFYNRDHNGNWIRSDRSKMSLNDLKSHCRDIIDGKYSLFNEPDIILFEERVKSHKNFKYYTYKGTPDIRVIVYNKIPIMSYIRLPTKESGGKANLDLGAIGAGIDIAVGKTTYAIIGKSTNIENVPDTGIALSGLKIPYWDRILRYAVEASIATKLGFGAIDFLIDQELGPLIVELNARPGLSIQLANDDGLRWRLKKARGIKVKSVDQGIRLGKDLFGGEIEEEIETISGKQVIGLIENVTLISKDGNYKETVKAKVDTGADSTSIDRELAIRLGYEEVIKAVEAENVPADLSREVGVTLMKELAQKLTPLYSDLVDINLVSSSHGSSIRPYVKISLKMDDLLIETNATIYDRSKLQYPIILGRKSLSKFLIDPSKR
jgi:alpha-L-glutamate ligase-like protein